MRGKPPISILIALAAGIAIMVCVGAGSCHLISIPTTDVSRSRRSLVALLEPRLYVKIVAEQTRFFQGVSCNIAGRYSVHTLTARSVDCPSTLLRSQVLVAFGDSDVDTHTLQFINNEGILSLNVEKHDNSARTLRLRMSVGRMSTSEA